MSTAASAVQVKPATHAMMRRLNTILARVLYAGGGHLWPLVLAVGGLGLAALAVVVGLPELSWAHCVAATQFVLALGFLGLEGSNAPQVLAANPDIAAHTLLGWYMLFVVGYVICATGLTLGGWWRYETPRLMTVAWVVPLLPLLVGLLDLAGTLTALATLQHDPTGWSLRGGRVTESVLTVLTCVRWVVAAVLLITMVMSVAVWFSRRKLSFVSDPRNQELTRAAADRDADEVRKLQQGNAFAIAPASRSAKVGPGPMFVGFNKTLWEQEYYEVMRKQTSQPKNTDGLGICFSGGGIRAAAFALGVLCKLEKKYPEELRTVRRITAVSGGAWTASAWTILRAISLDGGHPSPRSASEDLRRRLVQDPAEAAREQNEWARRNDGKPWSARLRYLLNGPGGLLGPISWVLLCMASTVALLVSIVYILAWIPGRMLRLEFLYPHIARMASGDFMLGWLNPGMIVIYLGLLFLFVVGCTRVASLWVPAVAVIVIGIAIYVYTAGLPWLLTEINSGAGVFGWLDTTLKGLAVFIAGVAVVGQIWTLAKSDVLEFAKDAVLSRLPRLLGVLLLIALVLLGAVVTAAAALAKNPEPIDFPTWIASPCALAVMVGILVLLYLVGGANSPSLAQIFGKRLRRSFDPSGADSRRVVSTLRSAGACSGSDVPGTWSWLRDRSLPSSAGSTIPELILCCAQQRNGLAPGGIAADSLTVSPTQITVGYSSRDLDEYVQNAVYKSAFGFREYPQIEYIASWLPITGAAFSSAMGRRSLGSTNAAMAAFNADLGTWIPNTGVQSMTRSRPRMAYILKEVLGWYSPADSFVFATDGGHWDNLGLVEQLRRGSQEIWCVDASDDPRYSFKTIREAIELASLEMCGKFSVQGLDAALQSLAPGPQGIPERVAARFTAKLDGNVIPITVVKLQLATTMPTELRRYAKSDPRFPYYPTANQFLSDEQFAKLVEAGEFAAGELMRCAEEEVSSCLARRLRNRDGRRWFGRA